METSTSTHATTYRLNLQKGITNIGSHPANDIVIDDPRVQPFHLILDHRKKPYQIIPLSPESNIRLNGVTVAGNDPIEVKDLNQVQFNGFSLHANPNPVGGETDEIEITPPRYQSEVPQSFDVVPVLPEVQAPEAALPAPVPGLARASEPRQFPPALRDDIILVTLIEVNQQVDVEVPAVYRLSVINAGPIVASFDVRVEGVPPEWVSITPRKLNLYESGRGECEIRIAAPRDSASTAATYPLQFSVSSPNYPDHLGQANSSFVLNPFFEYTLGNLDPKQRSASYNRRTGAVAFPISNLGNSPEVYQVSAADDENGLQFEFPQPDQTRLARQSEVKVGAGETKIVPMIINPIRRHFFRMRGRQYHYNVHARQIEQESGGQLVSGGFTSQPLLGFFSLLLILVVAAVSMYFLMRPHIIEFYAVKDIVEKGQAVTLRWKVSFFTRNLYIEGIADPIQGTQSQVSTMPTSVASTYTLVASNWLSRTLRMPDLRSAPVTVLTIPAPPAITTFSVDKNEAFVGDTIKAKWSIGNADLAYLTVDGITTILDPEAFNGELPITLARDTLVVLEAKNNAGSLVRSEYLQARQPSILIEEFSLSKTTITLGDPVTIKWKVSGIGVESVMIAPFEEPLPLTGELTFYPKESMEFVMSVANRDLSEIRLLPVGVLPPGTPPEPPAISFFKAAPEERVGEGTVEFSWSVSGTTDKIEITNSSGLVAGALPAQGFKSTLVKQTTNFIMTAYNKTASSSAIVEVKIKPDLMPTQVLIHSTIPNSAIMRGDTMQVYFSVKPLVNGLPVDDVIAAKLPEVSGKVVVTDGFDTCEAELPKTSCVITLNTSSANKKLTATYYGDATYARRTSPPYPETGVIMVMGTPTRFVQNTIDNKTIDGKPIFSQTDVVTGELATLTFFLAPKDPSKVDPVSGEVQVLDITDDQENGVQLCRVNLGGVVGFPNEGTAFCTFSFPTAGTKNLRVRYMGNAVYDGVIYPSPTDSPLSLEVNEGETVTKITSNLSAESVTGQPVPVSVLVQAKVPASGTPSGVVRIYDVNNSAASCHATLTNGIGSCEIVFTEAGDNRQVLANYGGDLNFLESDSLIVNHTVKQAATKTVFTSFPAPTYVGQTISFGFKSEIVAPGSGTLSGEAVVMDGGTKICSIAHVNNGVGTCSTIIPDSTAKAYRVIYDPADAAVPDPNYATSESPVTTYSPLLSGTKFTVFTQSAAEGAVEEPVTYTVGVIADPTSPTPPVGTIKVLSSSGEPCDPPDIIVPGNDKCSITFGAGGIWTVKAYFIANANYTASESAQLQYVVKKNSSVTVVSVSPSEAVIDQPVLFNVEVTSPTATATEIPTGIVVVTAGSQTCNVNLGKNWDNSTAPDPNKGSCRLIFNKEVTSLQVSAHYQGDTLFVASDFTAPITDPPILKIIRASTITKILSISPASPIYGQAFTVNFNVTPAVSAPYVSGPTGEVTIAAGAAGTCTGTVQSDGTGSCLLSLNSAGSHTLTANYEETPGVLRFSNSTAITYPVNVNKAQVTLSLSASPATIYTGQVISYTVGVAPVAPSIGAPSGTVTLTAKDDGSPQHSATGKCEALTIGPSTSTTTCTIAYPNPGTWTLTLSFEENDNYYGKTLSPALTTVVVKDTTSTTVSVTSPSPMYVDSPVVFMVRVAAGNSTTVPLTLPSPGFGFTLTPPSGSLLTASDITCDPLTFSTDFDVADPKKAYLTETCSFLPDVHGIWKFIATYPGDGNFNTSSSVETTVTVEPLSTPMTLTSNVIGDYYVTQSYIFTATIVYGTGAEPSKNVAFTSTGNSLPSSCDSVDWVKGGTPKAATATCTAMLTNTGATTVTANYPGDKKYPALTDTLSFSAQKDTTTTTVKDITGSLVVGTQVNFTVRVAAGHSTTVDLTLPSDLTFTLTKPNGSPASASLIVCGSPSTGLSPTAYLDKTCHFLPDIHGIWKVVATYPGDSNFDSSSSTETPITVGALTADIGLASDAATYHVNQEYTFTATINYVSDPAPTGNIAFTFAGNSLPGCSSLVQTPDPDNKKIVATCKVTFPNPVSTTVTATYPGDDKYASMVSSMTFPVKQTTVTTVNVTTASPIVDSILNFTVRVEAGNPTATPLTDNLLTFTLIPPSGSLLTSSAISCSWTGSGDAGGKTYLTADCRFTPDVHGDWKFTVTYPGDSNFASSTSTETTVIVAPLATPITLTSNVTGDYYVTQSYIFTATIVYGTGAAPSGNVVFTSTGTNTTLPLACASVAWVNDAGTKTVTAHCTTTLTNAGETTITASYAGDKKYPNLSKDLAITMVKDTTSTNLTFAAGPYVVGSEVTFTVKVSAGHSTTVDLTLPSSGFDFTLTPPSGSALDESAIICASPNIGFEIADPKVAYLTSACSFTPDVLGDWKFTATYPEDPNFDTSSSTETTVTVSAAP